jgi:arylsulfatase A-like enzyme
MKEPHHDSLQHPLFGITQELNPEQIDFSKKPTAGPLTQGFNYSFILPASLDMPPYCYLENDQLTELPTAYTKGNKLESGYTGPFWREGLMTPSFDFHDVLPMFTRKAEAFIRNQQNANNPFFLYFPMPAPHTPWVPTQNYLGSSQAGEYGDFVQQVDASVGQILSLLDSLGMTENTIVIFTSDNGPYWRENFVKQFNHKSASAFRGMKGDAHEGGHRVPFIVRFPRKVKPGIISPATTSLANLMATCTELLNDQSGKFETEDSYSILPILTGKDDYVKDQPAIVNISSKGHLDIRKENWKLINALGSGGFTVPAEIKPKAGEPTGQLFNLASDIHEDRNLYLENPDKVMELKSLLEQIQKAPKGRQFRIH